jgi:hypothetical protein
MGTGQKQPEFIDLTEFKTTLTATFILPDTWMYLLST